LVYRLSFLARQIAILFFLPRFNSSIPINFSFIKYQIVCYANFTGVRRLKQHLLAEPVAALSGGQCGGRRGEYGVYALCLFLSEFVRHHLYLGVAAGSVAGLAVNFTASRYLVFRGRKA
jgi:hypothetical protein